MADDAVATATLGRLLHHAHVISLKGDSYRMKDRMKVGVVDFYFFAESMQHNYGEKKLQFYSGVDTKISFINVHITNTLSCPGGK